MGEDSNEIHYVSRTEHKDDFVIHSCYLDLRSTCLASFVGF